MNALVENPFLGIITDPKSRLSQPTVTYNIIPYSDPFPSTPAVSVALHRIEEIPFTIRPRPGWEEKPMSRITPTCGWSGLSLRWTFPRGSS